MVTRSHGFGESSVLAIDTETTGLDVRRGCRPFSVYTYDGNEYRYWVWDVDPKTRMPIIPKKTIKEITDYIDSFDRLVFHNYGFDIRMMKAVGIEFEWESRTHDTGIMGHVVHSAKTQAVRGKLKDMSVIFLEHPKDDEKALQKLVVSARRKASKLGWKIAEDVQADYWLPRQMAVHEGKPDSDPAHHVCDEYGCGDVLRTLSLYHYFLQGMRVEGLEEVYERERNLFPVIYSMMDRGITVSKKRLLTEIRKRATRISAAELAMKKVLSDETFNPASTHQLRVALFDKLGFQPVRRTKTSVSTDKSTIAALHSFAEKDGGPGLSFLNALATYRKAATARGYLTEYMHDLIDGRLYYSLKQNGTSTTRFSSQRPNAQNVGKGEDAIDEDGNPIVVDSLRTVFGPRKGRIWLAMDYSQLQLRIFAYISKEEGLIQAFLDGWDAHDYVAHRIYNLGPDEKPTKIQRRIGKACFHPDTEVLTKLGWKKIQELKSTDSVLQANPITRDSIELSWTNDFKVVKSFCNDYLINFKNEGINIRVTKDHRMLTWDQEGNIRRKKINDDPIVRSAESTPVSSCWSNAGFLVEQENYLFVSKDEVRLAAAIQADGSFSCAQIRFGFTKRRKVERLTKLLQCLGITFKYTVNTIGVHCISFRKEHCQQSLKLLNPDKTFSWDCLSLDESNRIVLLSELRHWDGGIYGKCTMTKYFSTVQTNHDVIQAIATMTERKTWLKKDNCSLLSIKNRSHSKGGTVKKSKVNYNGPVYCLSVPTSFLVVRDGGIPIISGNCNFGFIFGASAAKIEATAGIEGLWDTVTYMFPNAHRYLQQTKWEVRNNKYITVPQGYRLYLPYREGRLAEHAGVNYQVQGCEGSLVKDAMIRNHRYLEKIRHAFDEGEEPFITLQVHDEIIYEFPADMDDKTLRHHARKLKRNMEKSGEVIGMVTPVEVDIIRSSWDKGEPFDV